MTINRLYALKRFLVIETGLSDPALHVLIGITIFFVAYALSRSCWKAVAILASIQAANEINDYMVKGGHGLARFLIDTAFDTIWTLASPLAFAILVSTIYRRPKK